VVKCVNLNAFHPSSFLVQFSVAADHMCNTVVLEIIFLIIDCHLPRESEVPLK